LEVRKGLEVFLEAARRLPRSLKITFLGKGSSLTGDDPKAFLKARLKGRSFTLLPNLDRHKALEYLSKGTRLAVMPSLVDNVPNTVIECATHGIPFLAADAGGIPELLPDVELRLQLLFQPAGKALTAALQRYLGLEPGQRQALRERAKEVLDGVGNNNRVVEHYHRIVHEQVALSLSSAGAPPPIRLAEEEPLVTVAVTYYNLADYLPDVLASLAAQTYSNLEVLVVDDGSTSPVAVRILEEQAQLYPQFRFISQANAGLSAARNRALAEASGEFFLPVDADNVARPDMVATLVRGLRQNPDLSALACYLLAFDSTASLQAGKYAYAYRPTAGPHVMGCFRNVYGDANAIFRTADLRAVNGYEPDRDSTCEDWEAFVKLVHAGKRLDVVPEHLFFYRHRADSLVRNTSPWRNHMRILRQYFQLDDLPRAERMALWSALGGAHSEWAPSGSARPRALRHLVADRVNRHLRRAPWLHAVLRLIVLTLWFNPDQEKDR
jgi:glycosyltransferase involved in cell wall biosynthesis